MTLKWARKGKGAGKGTSPDTGARGTEKIKTTADKRDQQRPVPVKKDEDPAFFAAAKEVAGHGRTLLGLDRLYMLWQAVETATRGEGALVEVGAYRGGSSFFLARALDHFGAADRRLHVVDTFEGHPDFVTEQDLRFHPPGHFGDTSYDEVCAYLAEHANVRVHKGAFEHVADGIGESAFCFAHLDVDTYVSTRNCLAGLDGLLTRGAVVVLDDFGAGKCPGVKQAAAEFMAERGADYRLIRLQTQQACLIRC